MKSANTLVAYASDWSAFKAFAQTKEEEALPAPAGLLCEYFLHRADSGLSANSIGRHVSAIAWYHHCAGYGKGATQDPAVKEILRGIRRTLGIFSQPKLALTVDKIKRIISVCPQTPGGIRDRAMFAVGFVAELGRADIVQLQVEDITEIPGGYKIHIIRRGEDIVLRREYSVRACAALREWLAHAEINTGYVFRRVNRGGNMSADPLGDDGWAKVIKKRAEAAGLDPALFSGHSVRSGFRKSVREVGESMWRGTVI